MKKILFFLLVVLSFSGMAAAQSATAVYVEGDSSMKDLSGKLRDIDIGDSLNPGETVITKATGRTDLELQNKSTVVVRPNTVFTLGEVELEGEKQSVLSTTVGSVAFRLNKFSGRGPVIRTNSTVAGVRGTELTVYAGMDGSSLVVVEEGAVELEAQGKSVNLTKNEAVEVLPGQQPGEKFQWLGKEQDFSAWNTGKLDAFLKDPVEGVRRVEAQLAYFQGEFAKLVPRFEAADKEFKEKFEEFKRLQAAKEDRKAKELQTYLQTETVPLRQTLILNIRYYALSYLSMRRFVLGGMYVQMKSRYILKQQDPVYRDFLGRYETILKNYEDVIVPYIVEADI